jgi:hypothetical protein
MHSRPKFEARRARFMNGWDGGEFYFYDSESIQSGGRKM